MPRQARVDIPGLLHHVMARGIERRVLFSGPDDYADFQVFGVRPFLIFNLADAAITIGVVIILARSFLIREKGTNEPAGLPATEN